MILMFLSNLIGLGEWLVICGYILTVTAIGSVFFRRRSSTADYFLGGRAMKALPVAISLVAADLSAISYMGAPAWSFRNNLELFLLSCAFLLVAPVVMYLFMPFYARFKFFTGYEYLERRFDLKTRSFGAGLFLINRGCHVAIVIYAPSIALSTVTGMPLHDCVLLMGVFATIYTTLGGMKAVIWTDVLQFSVLVLGIVTVCWSSLSRIPGGVLTAFEVARGAGRLLLFDFSVDPSRLTTVWAMLIGGGTMVLATMGTDQAYLQRYFTTKSLKEGQRSILMDALIAVPVSFMLYLIGIALYVFYHHYPDRLRGLPLADAILPFFVLHEIGGFFGGLIIASIFAASMAVMSAGINSLTTVTTLDFYKRIWKPESSDGSYVLVGRMGTIVWGIAATVGALFVNRLGPVVNAFNLVNSFLGGPLLGIFLLGMLTRRAVGNGALLGGALGLTTVACAALETHLAFFYFPLLGVLVTFGSGYLISLFWPARSVEELQGLVQWISLATESHSQRKDSATSRVD